MWYQQSVIRRVKSHPIAEGGPDIPCPVRGLIMATKSILSIKSYVLT